MTAQHDRRNVECPLCGQSTDAGAQSAQVICCWDCNEWLHWNAAEHQWVAKIEQRPETPHDRLESIFALLDKAGAGDRLKFQIRLTLEEALVDSIHACGSSNIFLRDRVACEISADEVRFSFNAREWRFDRSS